MSRVGRTAALSVVAGLLGALAWGRAGPGVPGTAAPAKTEARAHHTSPSPSNATIFAPAPGSQARHSGPPHEFYFTRAVYSGSRGGWGGRGSWAIDFPKADQQFLIVLDRLVDLDAYDDAHPVRLDDPNLRRFPFIYALEVGWMSLTDAEVEGLRSYLLAGGFVVIDDFWGRREWANFEAQMRRVLPDHRIVDLPLDHPVFHTVYDIDEVIQVPNVRQGMYGGPTHESGGVVPLVRGILDEKGRLMMVINFNTDLGDAWEWAENPYYPLKYSTYAIQMGVNMVVYGMSH